MDAEKNKLGLIHIYTVEGKGKTSAGMGLVVRALGRGLKVKIIQLFKRNTGEQFFFENSGVPYLQFKPLHPYFKNYHQEELSSLKKEVEKFLRDSISDMSEYDLILIDELGPGVNWGMVSEDVALEIIARKPEKTELILTGRDYPKSLIEKADYVSDIHKEKHPYDSGILARKGIEF